MRTDRNNVNSNSHICGGRSKNASPSFRPYFICSSFSQEEGLLNFLAFLSPNHFPSFSAIRLGRADFSLSPSFFLSLPSSLLPWAHWAHHTYPVVKLLSGWHRPCVPESRGELHLPIRTGLYRRPPWPQCWARIRKK